MKRRPLATLLASLVLLTSLPAQAQTGTPAAEGVPLAETLAQMTRTAGAGQIGELLRVSTALESGTLPFGTASGSFVFNLDPTTGLEQATTTTFGPSFAERAITAGAGKMSMAVSFLVATYDKLGDLDLDRMPLSRSEATAPQLRQTGLMSLVLSSETTVMHAVMGASDKLDIGVMVPIVKVKVDGISWVENEFVRTQANGEVAPDVLRLAAGGGKSSGLGDVGLSAKYRFLKFGGPPQPNAPLEPDPGGLALLGTVRLPTGDRANLRGLGITRVLGSLVASAGKGKFRPHANVGFEWWEKGIDVAAAGDPTITQRHQFQYAAGVELEASRKLTVIVDVLGRHVLGGGELGSTTATSGRGVEPGMSSFTHAVVTDGSVRKLTIAPGVKWNVKGKILVSLSGLASLDDNGLHDTFTPVVGLNWIF